MALWRKTELPAPDRTLPGRDRRPFTVRPTHAVLGTPMEDTPDGYQVAVFGLGCFWGAERLFWQAPGVWTTSVGYAGGSTPHPTYEEVCTGQTGHAEVVRVVFDPAVTSYDDLLRIFWEAHDPTQGYRQGNDIGTQYRSAIYTTGEEQRTVAERSKAAYETDLKKAGYGAITTEVAPLGEYFLAEEYHQQYLYKNPGGYCGIAGTGITCAVGG